jgi:hypothetical protein
MSVPVFSAPRSLVEALGTLVSTGTSSAASVAQLAGGHAAGWWTTADSATVATQRLLSLIDAVPTLSEAPAAIIAREPVAQASWARIIAAHLIDAGSRRDRVQLCDDITALGLAAGAVLAAKPHASLAPTGWSDLEHQVLGAPAHEAIARPRLVRALAAAASQPFLPPPAPLLLVDPLQPGRSWSRGRLVQMPDVQASLPATPGHVLTGACAAHPAPESGHDGVMRWVLDRPWAYLLAQVVFVQEAWQAERISGRLSLEVAEDQRDLMRCPPQVFVIVTRANGQEVQCGTLGEFLRRILGVLGVGVIAHRMTAAALDAAIVPVIGVLLEREIWQADYGGLGRRPGYAIHPAFSDTWGRIGLGSRVFYRASAPVTAAIRQAAETWADERCAVAAHLVASTRAL